MNSQNAYTPGPWEVGRKIARFVYAKNGTPICECDSMGEMEDLVGARKSLISAMEIANARLIAAAPELLEALQYAIRQVPDLATVPGIAAAIAKAGGAA